MKSIFGCLMMLLITACSAEQGYSQAQTWEQSRCVKGPASEYQNCMKQADMSYREYEALRETQGSNVEGSK
jgi:hypothetical protein